MARSLVGREIVKRGGQPVWRDGVVTDNGNWIIDVHGWQIADPVALESELNQLARRGHRRSVRAPPGRCGAGRRPRAVAATSRNVSVAAKAVPQCPASRERAGMRLCPAHKKPAEAAGFSAVATDGYASHHACGSPGWIRTTDA